MPPSLIYNATPGIKAGNGVLRATSNVRSLLRVHKSPRIYRGKCSKYPKRKKRFYLQFKFYIRISPAFVLTLGARAISLRPLTLQSAILGLTEKCDDFYTKNLILLILKIFIYKQRSKFPTSAHLEKSCRVGDSILRGTKTSASSQINGKISSLYCEWCLSQLLLFSMFFFSLVTTVTFALILLLFSLFFMLYA